MPRYQVQVSNIYFFLCESKYKEKIFSLSNSSSSLLYSSRMSIKLYEDWCYEVHEVSLTDSNTNLVNIGFNDKVSSVKVESGKWILWEHIHFKGKYYIIGPGHYDVEHLKRTIGNDKVSSVQKLSNTA